MQPARTLVQKIIARASGQAEAVPGALAVCEVDLAMAHDSSGPRRWKPHLAALGIGLWDPAKVVIVSDHYVPAVDGDSAAILKLTRDFVRDYNVGRFYDMQGICHVVLPEHGLVKPGMFVAGGDSHTPTAGAFAAYALGFGATDMLGVVATGQTWTIVPETVRVEWSGEFGLGVAAKDIMLSLCRDLGVENAFKVIEYGGDTVRAMGMAERMTLANMSAELGFDTGLVEADETTIAHLLAHGGAPGQDALSWRSDPGAPYAAVFHYDASALTPQVAAPHSPANSGGVVSYSGVSIDQAYIGACVGAKIEDLHMAAQVLAGRRVAPGVRLMVAPASRRTSEIAARDGTLATLLEAGAILAPSGCGACAGMGAGLLAEGETCISTTNRNFKGRMGHHDSFVYLASPYTVAAAAVAGRIIDPRDVMRAPRCVT